MSAAPVSVRARGRATPETRDRVLTALRIRDWWMTPPSIAKRAKLHRNTVQRALLELLCEGAVERVHRAEDRARLGLWRSSSYWRIAADHAASATQSPRDSSVGAAGSAFRGRVALIALALFFSGCATAIPREIVEAPDRVAALDEHRVQDTRAVAETVIEALDETAWNYLESDHEHDLRAAAVSGVVAVEDALRLREQYAAGHAELQAKLDGYRKQLVAAGAQSTDDLRAALRSTIAAYNKRAASQAKAVEAGVGAATTIAVAAMEARARRRDAEKAAKEAEEKRREEEEAAHAAEEAAKSKPPEEPR